MPFFREDPVLAWLVITPRTGAVRRYVTRFTPRLLLRRQVAALNDVGMAELGSPDSRALLERFRLKGE